MRARRADPLSDELTALDELEDEIRRPKRKHLSLIVPILITMIVVPLAVRDKLLANL